MKAGVFPCAHLGDEFGSNEAFGNEQFKDVGFKQLSQHIFLKEGNSDKGTIDVSNRRSGKSSSWNFNLPLSPP